VVGKTRDSAFPTLDCDDSLNNADGNFLFVERGALLDVEFDKGG